ncbi:hypothetical protein B0J13DRAFT_531505 [Dactylonectria estremocensis]|uniref:NACHT domain-containing protein n=1 Tax=Dactylonectria estremocensis TaxID=1079267 RepID=A0A9P9DQX4_9HYPO|nr:hypothetical protein B0J13DRAFT_531505 [Dactylonectria estremocensis]
MADKEIFEMHALVQFCTQVWLSSFSNTQQRKQEFLKVISDQYPSGEYENWPECKRLDPHIDKILKEKPNSSEDVLRWARLLTNAGWYRWMKGMYEEAGEMNRRALEIRERVLGREHPDTLTSVHILALVLQDQGKHEEAEQMNRRTLDAKEKVLGRIDGEIKAETRREVHTWLLGRHSANELYDDSIQKRLDGTCDWILDQPAFLHWLSPDFPAGTAKLLWIYGPAGFGKTILCARVVEHLSSTLATPVAHFFFSPDFESRGDPFAAIRSWISQVMSRDQGAFDLVRGRWEAQQEQVATRADVVKLFRELVRAVPGCTLVLDGLDECTSMSENRMVAGSESVERCLKTVKQAVADTTTRVMLVSRDEPDIRHALMDNTGEEFAEYKISPEDVRADTASYSRSIVDRKLYNKNKAIKVDISRRMADRCEGQFLWLKMQEDCLSRGKNQKQLEAAIDETPTGLEPVLIDDDCDDLPIDELPDAIDEDYIDSEIMDLCGSLLEVRSTPSEPSAGLRTVHLTHFSVKQYLLCNIPAQGKRLLANESLRASNEAIESTVLAKLCLRYINFPRVWHGTLQEQMGPLEKSFRDYAAGLWYRHANLGVSNDADVIRLTNVLFDRTNANWDSWRQWFDSNDEELKEAEPVNETRPPSPLYYASKLELTGTVIYLIQERKYDADEKSSSGRTALGASCANGSVTIVKILLDAEANVTVANKGGVTSLIAASLNGHVEVVKLLLEKGADVEVANNNGRTPLNAASHSGHVGVVKLLLEKGADVTVANNNGWTPLNSASDTGHVEVVKLLLLLLLLLLFNAGGNRNSQPPEGHRACGRLSSYTSYQYIHGKRPSGGLVRQ